MDPSEKIVRRGKRRPDSVWIEKRPSGGLRLRWVDPTTGAVMSQACGKDRALARALRTKKAAELRDGLSGRLPTKTLSNLISHVEVFLVGKSASTVSKTKQSLKKLRELVGDRLLEQVTREAVMEFRAKRLADGLSLASVNKAVREIRSAFSFATDAGWLRHNVLLRWKGCQVREPEKSIRVVEPEEFAKLLAAAADRSFRTLLLTAYHQGLRRTELCQLRWDAVDLEAGVIRVVNRPDEGEFTKSRRNRAIPLHPTVKTELAKLRAKRPTKIEDGKPLPKSPFVFIWPDGRAFKPDWVTHQFAKLAKTTGISATIHDLRRSFSTLAQRAGVDRHLVKDLGGWSSVSVVERHYSGQIEVALKRAMDQIAKSQGVA